MKPKNLGIGDKSTISGDPQDLGLNSREGYDKNVKLRGETKSLQPEVKKHSVSSDRGTFKCQ